MTPMTTSCEKSRRFHPLLKYSDNAAFGPFVKSIVDTSKSAFAIVQIQKRTQRGR